MGTMVPDINNTYEKAIDAGCTEVQPITEIPDYGVSNAMFSFVQDVGCLILYNFYLPRVRS